MFKERGKVSTINKVLVTMLIIVSALAVVMILLPRLNKKNVETHVKETEGMIENYTTTEENSWDVSKNGDGSVIATLSDDGTLTISGTGDMKDWSWSVTTDWHNSEIKEKVKKAVVDEGVTSIGDYTFYGCSSLTSIDILEGVRSIGDYIFVGCSSLTSINIPEGVTSIGREVFYGCSSLISINIPEGVTSIGREAFRGCSSLTSIDIPAGVTDIGISAFNDCNSLKEIKVDINNKKYMDNNGVLYTKDKTTIIKYPQDKKDAVYIIQEGVTSIERDAFYGCSNLTSIKILEGITIIGSYAFKGCSSLTSINIPEGVTSMAFSVFEGCSSLTNISIPSSVTIIETYSFRDCSSLTSINIPEGVTSIGTEAFSDCSSLTSINIPSRVTSIGRAAFSGCSSLTSITIPEVVTSIGEYAFSRCSDLTIICKSETIAETYAKENQIRYQIDDNGPTIKFLPNGTDIPVKVVETKITAEDELAGVNEDSLKYLWTIQSENVTKDQIINNFQNGETLNPKDVTGTYYLWIYAKDYLGNENIVRSEAFELDNTMPTTNISYSTTKPTKENVKVTITVNEEIQSLSGWELSTDKKVLIKEYSENKTETITLKDIAGNESTVQIKVTGIIKFKEETYNIDGSYIIGIQPKTTYENFIKNIVTNREYKVTEDDKEITGNTLIKTGQKLIMDDKSVTLVVIGDANGDGQADLRDILAINKHRLNKAQLVNEYLLAGDINEDKKVDLRDILQINKYRLGKISLL